MSRYHKVYSRARDPHIVAYIDRDNEMQLREVSTRERAEATAACAHDNEWTLVSVHRGGLTDLPSAVRDELRNEIHARAALTKVAP